MKRTITYLLLALVASSVLTGCSKDPGVSPGPPPGSRTDGKAKMDVSNLKGGDLTK